MSKRYNIIYADPPWAYNDKMCPGKRGVSFKYNTMSLDDIFKLPVKDLAADNCTLFLWTTFPHLANGLKTVEAWGFRYRTAGFVWVKTNSKSGTLFMGMGHYTRSNAEICLLGIKGKPKRVNAGINSMVLAPRGRHSEKPAEIRNKIVKLMGDIPRIELFARSKVEGWDVWGNEAPNAISWWPREDVKYDE